MNPGLLAKLCFLALEVIYAYHHPARVPANLTGRNQVHGKLGLDAGA